MIDENLKEHCNIMHFEIDWYPLYKIWPKKYTAAYFSHAYDDIVDLAWYSCYVTIVIYTDGKTTLSHSVLWFLSVY